MIAETAAKAGLEAKKGASRGTIVKNLSHGRRIFFRRELADDGEIYVAFWVGEHDYYQKLQRSGRRGSGLGAAKSRLCQTATIAIGSPQPAKRLDFGKPWGTVRPAWPRLPIQYCGSASVRVPLAVGQLSPSASANTTASLRLPSL